jgi:enterochelin esterase-like enzyme
MTRKSSLFLFCFLLSFSIGFAAESSPARKLIDLVRQSPGSPQLQELLVKTVPAADLKAGTAALSDHGDGLFAVESDSAVALFVDATPSVAMKQDVPSFGPESYEKPGVPQGKLTGKMVFASKIFDGMQSDYWVYTPAQYDPKVAAPLMVWDDGQQYINHNSGSIRFLEVVDNLTDEKKIPPIVYVFTMPGVATMPEGSPFYLRVKNASKGPDQAAMTNALRGVEYETLSGQYARFLRDELLPEVEKTYNIRKDGYSRAIAGLSSGALGAFTAAWEQPDQFSRVLVWVTPFTSGQWQPGMRDGGNIYPFRIRKEPKKNLRLWIQHGCDDLEVVNGSVPLQNIAVATSLKLREYPMDEAEKAKPFFRVHIFNRE